MNAQTSPDPRPVRVLQYLPSLACSAGMVNVVMNYYRHMSDDLVAMDFIYLDEIEPGFKAELEARGCRCTQVSLRGGGQTMSMRAYFAAHAGEYDVLHCHPIYAPELLGPPARKAGIGHIIAHSHSSGFSEKRLSAIRNRIMAQFVGLFATDYFACSDAARVLLGPHGGDALIVRNAIDCARYSYSETARAAVRRELGVDPSTRVLGNLGRLSEEKNQAFLLDVARVLKDMGADFRLVIAGDGTLREALEAKVAQLDLQDEVLLLGSRADGPALYAGFDAFALPSLFEGLPVCAVEAQCAGLPCLISSTVTHDMAFGQVDYLPLDDPHAWAQRFLDLELTSDEQRRTGAALARQAGYDITCEAVKLQDLYLQMKRS